MNISLIGMMGCGKSTIGKILNELLENYTFIDTDEEIISKEKCSINEIFETKGETYFRKVETDVLKKILQNKNQIISTGGGIIKDENNLKILKENSLVIYLSADTNTLYERVKNNTERPLLKTNNLKEKITTLLKEREIQYRKAHIIINTEEKSTNKIAEEIIEELRKNEKSKS